MPEELTSLVIKVDAIDATAAERKLDKLEKTGGKLEKRQGKLKKSTKESNMALRSTAIAAGAATSAYAALRGSVALFTKALERAKVMQNFEAQLKTATGSIDDAASAMDNLRRFAKETPFTLNQSIEAFVKLKNLGLDPSQEALKSYGNTASAMGKSMSQMIEAVADASTLEFERLKEFGIRAKQNATSVTFTFQGVATTIGKSAEEIEEYLKGIGKVQFAGAMEERMNTIGGQLSNLADSWDNFFDTLNKQGLSDVMSQALKDISGSLQDMTKWATSGGADQIIKDISTIMTTAGHAADGIKRMSESFNLFKENPAVRAMLDQMEEFNKSYIVKGDTEGIKAMADAWDETSASFGETVTRAQELENALESTTKGALDGFSEFEIHAARMGRIFAEEEATLARVRGKFLETHKEELKLALDITTTAEDKLQAQRSQLQATIDNVSASEDEVSVAREALGILDQQTEAVRERNREQKSALSLVMSLETDAERATRRRFDTEQEISKNGAFNDRQRAEAHKRNNARYDEEIASIKKRNAASTGGSSGSSRERQDPNALQLGVSLGLGSNEDQINARFENDRALILENTRITEEQRTALEIELTERRNMELAELDRNKNAMILGSAAQTFDGLAGLTLAFAGEQSSAYKVLFGISKGFAIAEATINMWSAASKAFATGVTPIDRAAHFASALTFGGNIISSINSLQAGNFANGGIVGGTSYSGDNMQANVNSGEMILNGGQQKELFSMANGSNGGSGGVKVVINNLPGQEVDVKETETDQGKQLEFTIKQTEKYLATQMDKGTGALTQSIARNTNARRK